MSLQGFLTSSKLYLSHYLLGNSHATFLFQPRNAALFQHIRRDGHSGFFSSLYNRVFLSLAQADCKLSASAGIKHLPSGALPFSAPSVLFLLFHRSYPHSFQQMKITMAMIIPRIIPRTMIFGVDIKPPFGVNLGKGAASIDYLPHHPAIRKSAG